MSITNKRPQICLKITKNPKNKTHATWWRDPLNQTSWVINVFPTSPLALTGWIGSVRGRMMMGSRRPERIELIHWLLTYKLPPMASWFLLSLLPTDCSSNELKYFISPTSGGCIWLSMIFLKNALTHVFWLVWARVCNVGLHLAPEVCFDIIMLSEVLLPRSISHYRSVRKGKNPHHSCVHFIKLKGAWTPLH